LAVRDGARPRTPFPQALVFLSGHHFLGRAAHLRFRPAWGQSPRATLLTLQFDHFARDRLLAAGSPWRGLDLTLLAGACRQDGRDAEIRLRCEGHFLSLPAPVKGAPAVIRLNYIHASAGALRFWETGRPRRLSGPF